MAKTASDNLPTSTPPPQRAPSSPRRTGGGFFGLMLNDVRGFSPGRTLTVAHLAIREALRLKVLGVVVLGLVAIVLADVTTVRFDPVFDTASSLTRIMGLVILVIGFVFTVFLSTYSLPRELSTRTIYSLVTKPVSRLEIVLGKALGLVAVLGLVTFGLGLLGWGYAEWRGGRVQRLAGERLADLQATDASDRLPTDLPPAALEAVADRGPFRAVELVSPGDPLTIVLDPSMLARADRTISEDEAYGRRPKEWLSGWPAHRAHWGFEHLPPDEVDEGKARIVLQLALPALEQTVLDKLDESKRQVLVRVLFEGRQVRPPWARAVVMDPDGRLVVPFPAKEAPDQPDYRGERIWISVAGAGTPPLGVADATCTIELSTGKAIQSQSGLRMTGEYQVGRYRIGGESHLALLAARVRFQDIDPTRIGPHGAVLHVEVGVPGTMPDVGQARTRVVAVVESPNGEAAHRLLVTFRPERRAATLIPLSPDDFPGGTLAVYITSDNEVTVTEDSVHLQLAELPFLVNWLKSLWMMWLSFSVLGGMGIFFATIAGWQVASFAAAAMFVVANVWNLAIENIRRYGVSLSGLMVYRQDTMHKALTTLYETVFGLLGAVLPNFGRLDVGDQVARGENVPLVATMLAFPEGALWYALLYTAAAVLLGYACFLRKEVAQ